MKLLFVRHAKALERLEWMGDDMLRPLTEEGIKKARRFFGCIAPVYRIEAIATSKAVRAVQTAKILQEFYPEARYIETPDLNPGASILAIERTIARLEAFECVALVGHEPDFSLAVAHLIGCEHADIRLKKAGIAELAGDGGFELRGLLYPKLFEGTKCSS
jgi:phosphohistidine phosphatase